MALALLLVLQLFREWAVLFSLGPSQHPQASDTLVLEEPSDLPTQLPVSLMKLVTRLSQRVMRVVLGWGKLAVLLKYRKVSEAQMVSFLSLSLPGLVHLNLAVEESLGEVLELGCPLVAIDPTTGHVALVTSPNIHQSQSHRGKQTFLPGLAAPCGVLLRHPALLLLEVGHGVLPQLHEENGLGETRLVQTRA